MPLYAYAYNRFKAGTGWDRRKTGKVSLEFKLPLHVNYLNDLCNVHNIAVA